MTVKLINLFFIKPKTIKQGNKTKTYLVIDEKVPVKVGTKYAKILNI